MNLERFLEEQKAWHRFMEKETTVHTADAAARTGLELNRISKSLVLLDQDGNPILAMIPGDCKLSFEKLRPLAGAKKLRLCPFEEAEKHSGYPPGATPMVGHKERMRVFLDRRFLTYETIYGGGGSRTRLLEMRTEDVIRINGAVVADITE